MGKQRNGVKRPPEDDDKDRVITKPVIEQWKGQPILRIPVGGGWAFGFGVRKAGAILDNVETIRAFYDSDGKSLEVEG